MEFDNVELLENIELEDSINDGSIADIEEEEDDGNVNKTKKFTKKRIHHRTEEEHESSSGSDSDDNVDVRNKFAILNTNPVSYTSYLFSSKGDLKLANYIKAFF